MKIAFFFILFLHTIARYRFLSIYIVENVTWFGLWILIRGVTDSTKPVFHWTIYALLFAVASVETDVNKRHVI